MTHFFPLAIKLLPLYVYILLGYIAGKKLDTHQETIAKLMFYIVTPIIVFNGTLNTPLSASVLSLPILTFFVSCFLCIVFYRISRRVWTDSSKNMVAFSAGSGATGYFGIPLAMIIFTPEKEGIYMMALLGVTLYDYSLGYYISAKGTYTALECFYKLLKVPTLYAFALGLFFNVFQFSTPDIYQECITQIRGVYTVLGMMIVGVGIAGITSFKMDFKFIGMTFLAKFVVWPLLVFAVISLDENYLGIYDPAIYEVLILLSIVPIAINTILMASLTKCHPDKVAGTLLLSILFALVYVPFMAEWLI